jgi:CRP/FNR family transcriptional regulator
MGVLTSRMSPDLARLLRQYPSLAAIDPGLRDEVIAHQVQWIQAPEGAMLFDEGSRCRGFPMVISGEVRVARGSTQGRALELYRVSPGELCVASTSCTVGARPMQAHGIATQPTELALLDPAGFDRWCGEPSFRRFVFAVFAERLADLMALVEAVAFQRLDQRLAAALLGYGPVVHVTHQALAEQLGTAREIVTRLLKRFEQAGQVHLSRERIDVLDAVALRARAEPTDPV